MTDITKCNGKRKIDERVYTCPFRSKCRRYLVPSGAWQSWFAETPLERDPKTGAPSCKYRESMWSKQASEPGATVIPHNFDKSNNGPYCKECGWPEENHRP
jgi:hypothetical protein